jgi:hypothetical protein
MGNKKKGAAVLMDGYGFLVLLIFSRQAELVTENPGSW